MNNIYVMPTVKEHADNKTVYVEIMRGKKVRGQRVARKGEKRRRSRDEGTAPSGERGRRLTAVHAAT